MYNTDVRIISQIKPIKKAMKNISEKIKLSLKGEDLTDDTLIVFKKEYLLLSYRWRKIINEYDLFFT